MNGRSRVVDVTVVCLTILVVAVLVWLHVVEGAREEASERASDVVTAARSLDAATARAEASSVRGSRAGGKDVTVAQRHFQRGVDRLAAATPLAGSGLPAASDALNRAVRQEVRDLADDSPGSAASTDADFASPALHRVLADSGRLIDRLREEADDANAISWWAAIGLVIAQTFAVLGIARRSHHTQRRVELAEVTSGAERRFESLVASAADMIGICGVDGKIIYISPAAEAILEYTPEEILEWNPFDHIHPDDVPMITSAAGALGEPGRAVRVVFRVQRRDGKWRSLDNVITNLTDDPAIGGLIWNARDVTAQLELEAQLTFQAFHDPLTGLANRALLHERLDHALASARRRGTTVGVVFLDLDGFKNVNDTLGHDHGDRLITEVAARLAACLRPGDTLARLGGDEFAAILEDIDGPSAATVAAERLVEILRGSFRLRDRDVFATASAGVSLTIDGQEPAEQLLRNADVAMYVAKAGGGDRVAMFEAEMHQSIADRTELIVDLHGAIDRGELEVLYQPTVSISDGHIEGAEALLRWHHPTRGLIPPAIFIPLAESSGQIVPIGRWVIEQACTQAATWPSPLTIAINLSPRQLQDPHLIGNVETILRTTGLSAHRVVLEVTESALMDDPVTGLERLNALKALGLRLAVDDFGTGYSSLAQLKEFPVDIVKIDKSFIDTLTHKPDGDAFVQAIIQLAHALELDTIAEGVEQLAQHEALQAVGCHLAQGFLFAKPLNAHALHQLLNQTAPQPV